jgi:hypothetical protein
MRHFILWMPFVLGTLMGLTAIVLAALGLFSPDPAFRGLAAIAVLPAAFSALFIPLGVVIMVVVRRREARQDAAFSMIGAGRPLGFPSRQWHGEFAGRRVDVFFQKGPLFEVFMEVEAGWRMSLAQRNRLGRALARGMGREPLALDRPEFDDRSLYSEDEDRVTQLLAQVEPELLALSEPAGRMELAQVHVRPECVLWLLHYTAANPDPARIEAGLTHLAAIAQALDTMPSGDATSSKLERIGRVGRAAMQAKVMRWTLGCFGVFMVLATVGSVLVAYLSTSH